MQYVYLIVLNYNGWIDTIECLKSLLNINYPNYRIIIVDNCSIDDSIKKIGDWVSSTGQKKDRIKYKEYYDYEIDNNCLCTDELVILLKSSSNRGYSAGNNLGIKFALLQENLDYVWILNNDVVVDSSSLEKLIRKANSTNSKIAFWGSRVMFYYEPTIIQSLGGIYNYKWGNSKQVGYGLKVNDYVSDEEYKSINYVPGCAVLASKKVIHEVGLLNEDFFLFYEEIDWALRAKNKGYEIGFCYDSIVYHKDGSSTKLKKQDKQPSAFADFHITKSRMILTKKYFINNRIYIYIGCILIALKRIFAGLFENAYMIFKVLFQ